MIRKDPDRKKLALINVFRTLSWVKEYQPIELTSAELQKILETLVT